MSIVVKKFENLVRKLGQLLRAEADRGLTAAKSQDQAGAEAPLWVSAFVDERWFVDTNNSSSKLRVVQPNGELYCLLASTRDMKDLLREIWSVRNQDDTAKWYGLKVSVTPDGVVTHELDNDPNCVVDPTWFDS